MRPSRPANTGFTADLDAIRDTALTQGFAWAYVVLRIVHSLWQALVNVIPVRFALFALSSLVLFVLLARAAMQVF